MKLQLVPARQGALWVRYGLRVFFRRPLAYCVLFGMCLFLAPLFLFAAARVPRSCMKVVVEPLCQASRSEAISGAWPMALDRSGAVSSAPEKTLSGTSLSALRRPSTWR